MGKDRLVKLIGLGVLVGIFFVIPPPKGLSVEGWRLAGIFIASIVGIVTQALHEAALLLVAFAIMALAGTIAHIAHGDFQHHGLWRTVFLAFGVVIGAQVGAKLSSRIHGNWIIERFHGN